MINYIFISKIFESGDDYNDLSDSFNNVYTNYIDIEEIPSATLNAVLYPTSNILLISGKGFHDIPGSDYLEEIKENSYKQLIDNIEFVYNEIKKQYENKHSDKLKEFSEVFKPEETVVCIHWGGKSKNEEINKIVEDILKKNKDKKVYKITYFSSKDLKYEILINKDNKFNKQDIMEALDFYSIRVENLLVKKKIYDLMEKIYIYHFPFIKDKFSIEKENPFYKVIKEEIEFLKDIMKILKNNDVVRTTKDFLTHFPNIEDKIEIEDVEIFRKKTYEYLNYTTFPIYPKFL